MESNGLEVLPEKRYYTLIKYILMLSPVYLFIGCYIIWIYLNDIGWLSLFISSIQGQYGSLASIFSFLIIAIPFSFVMFIPCYFICQLSFFVDVVVLCRNFKIIWIPIITFIASFFTLLFLAVISWWDATPEVIKKNSFIFLFTMLFALSFILTHLVSVKRKKDKPHYFYLNERRVKYRYFNSGRILTIFMIAFSGVAVVFPMRLVFDLGSAYSYSGVIKALFFAMIISLLSLIPALIFYLSLRNKGDVIKQLVKALYSSLFVFIGVLFLWPNLINAMSYNAFKKIGIIDDVQHIYEVSNIYYSPEMFPSPVWEHVGKEKNNFFVKGVSLFSFGELILICPSFVVKTKEKYLKYNFDKMFDSDDLAVRHLKNVAKSCVPARKTLASRWDAVQDKGNKLNSSEFQIKQ